MKTTIYLFILLFIIGACTKFDYTSDDTQMQYIDTEEELDQAVNGAYSKFADIFATGTMRYSYLFQTMLGDDYDSPGSGHCDGPGCWPQPGYGVPVLTDDNDTVLLSYGMVREWKEGDKLYDYPSYRVFMDQAYSDLYKAILAQNFILDQADNQKLNSNHVQILRGEIYYLRAYSYFRLTRLFGNVPLITDLEVNTTVTRASFVEIYAQIESDLLMAMKLLPVTIATARVPYITPCRGTAKALLAEVYLTMGGYPIKDASKYALAAKQAREVIDSASVFGFGLLDDFADLTNQNMGFNKEGVSIVHYSLKYTDAEVERLYGGNYESNELAQNYPGNVYAETQFYNNYPDSYRRNQKYSREVMVRYTDPITNVLTISFVYPKKITSSINIRFWYWVEHGNDTEFTLYILRYAHTLLTYAEANAHLGNIDGISYEAVNKIRRRANHVDLNTPSKYDLTEGLSPKVFLDSVVWERAWEFTGEPEARWFDLIRLEMMDQLPNLRDSLEANFPLDCVQPGEYFFDLPEYDIFLNPNLAQ